jgi:glycosyltransferase involved in cell wall biosynthesis
VDVAIEASRLAGIPLRIVGRGPEEVRLRKRANGRPVEFLGWRTSEEIRELYQTSSMVVLPGVEDFGIVPVEAQACGTPVVALDEGGARETIVSGVTGALTAPGPHALADAMRRVMDSRRDVDVIRQNAERFSRSAFRERFTAAVAEAQEMRP